MRLGFKKTVPEFNYLFDYWLNNQMKRSYKRQLEKEKLYKANNYSTS